MSDTQKAAIERLRRDQQRYTNLEMVAKAVENAERSSYARTELTHTDALGLAKRQDIASRLGQSMHHSAVDFMRRVASECQTPEELEVGARYARMFNGVSEQSYAEFLMDHLWEER